MTKQKINIYPKLVVIASMCAVIVSCSSVLEDELDVTQSQPSKNQVVEENVIETEDVTQDQTEISQEEHDNNTDLSIINLVERAKLKYQRGIETMQNLINEQKQKAKNKNQ